jgi:cytochrome c peroxidase
MRTFLFILTTSSALAANLPPDHAKRMERGLKLFDSEVAALLKQNCLKCHGGEKVKSDFDRTEVGIIVGFENSRPENLKVYVPSRRCTVVRDKVVEMEGLRE